MTQRMVDVNGVSLCVETFGDPADPAILLIHGAGASMMGWPDGFCAGLASGGRYVIRFDQRDTGRATSWPAGEPTYGLRDLAQDAVGLLDVLHIDKAHVVGRSMGGGVALIVAIDYPERVVTLTLTCTTPGEGAGGVPLPGMSAQFLAAVPDEPAGSTVEDVVDFLVKVMHAYEGGTAQFDEPTTRGLLREDVLRTRSIESALVNHFRIDVDGPRSGGFDSIAVPTLIVHGERDPVFPLEHGQAFLALIEDAELMVMPDVGHEIPPRMWGPVISRILAHTARSRASEPSPV